MNTLYLHYCYNNSSNNKYRHLFDTIMYIKFIPGITRSEDILAEYATRIKQRRLEKNCPGQSWQSYQESAPLPPPIHIHRGTERHQ